MEIPIHGGATALVDDADYPLLSRHRWFLTNNGYAVCNAGGKSGILMHRLIRPDLPRIDHVNRNKLDNRRENLRGATAAENRGNGRKKRQAGITSNYKGVGWSKEKAKWRAYIIIDYRFKHLGYFVSETDAANAYDVAAREAFGVYALTNQNIGCALE